MKRVVSHRLFRAEMESTKDDRIPVSFPLDHLVIYLTVNCSCRSQFLQATLVQVKRLF